MISFRNSNPRPAIMQGFPPAHHDRVPHDAWDRAPWNRWSFQNIREILPTTEVWRGAAAPAALDERPVDLDDLPVVLPGGLTTAVSAFLDETYTDGFVVMHRGHIVYERLFNGMHHRTLHLSQSVAKSVIGALVGILADLEAVDPDAMVIRYLPEFGATAYRDVRLRHLLDMTSGVRFSEDYTDPFSDVGKLDVASGWKRAPAPGPWPASVHDLALGLRTLDRGHGERFVYRSIETDILAFCIERATGARLAPLVSELIWQPMGADESASYTVDPSGYALADGGLNACLRDYLRFGAIYAQDGSFNGRQIVPAAWVAETRRGNGKTFLEPYSATLPNGAYRNQFWIGDVSTGVLMARGVFGQLIHVDREAEMVTVKLSSWPDFQNPRMFAETLAAIRSIGNALR